MVYAEMGNTTFPVVGDGWGPRHAPGESVVQIGWVGVVDLSSSTSASDASSVGAKRHSKTRMYQWYEKGVFPLLPLAFQYSA
jgi:hypothetical protein